MTAAPGGPPRRVDVALRPWAADDEWLLQRLLGDPQMTRYLGGLESQGAIRARHERYLVADPDNHGLFAVTVGPAAEAVGWVGYWESEWHGELVWECGWNVLPEAQGRGVATAAAALMIADARRRGGHRHLHAIQAVGNAASNALCRTLGFELLGEVEVEYPTGIVMRSNDWRLDLEETGPFPRRITRDGVVLTAESFGNPSDPAVLLIMGAMASGVWWPEEFCRRLAASGRFVIRYDHRDTGGSTTGEPGAAGYATEDLADDVVRVLDGFGVAQAHLAGMSLGGFLAQLVALKYADRVLTLTLVASERLAAADPALPGMSPDIPAYHARAVERDWTDRKAVIAYQVGAWRLLNGPAHPFDEAGIRALAAADYERTPDPLTPMNHALLGDAVAWYGRLDEITQPALIIHGTADPVLPYAHAEALVRDLPAAELLTLPGTGHELHPDDWPAILEALVRHTRGDARRAG